MVLSSPVTRSYKSTIPAAVFGICTLAVLFVNRDDIESWETAVVLVVIYACAAWSLWRPFGLKVADQVEERGGVLWIRRGTVEVQVPYSSIERHDYLTIGSAPGIRLVFREPNALGRDIGMYLHVPLGKEPRPAQDPVEYLHQQLQKYRDGPQVASHSVGQAWRGDHDKSLSKKWLLIGLGAAALFCFVDHVFRLGVLGDFGLPITLLVTLLMVIFTRRPRP